MATWERCERCDWGCLRGRGICTSCQRLMDDIERGGFRPGMPRDEWTDAAVERHEEQRRGRIHFDLVRNEAGTVISMRGRVLG